MFSFPDKYKRSRFIYTIIICAAMGRARFLGVYCGHGPKTVAHISYKNLRYTFDKSAEKIDGRALLPSPHVTAWVVLKRTVVGD